MTLVVVLLGCMSKQARTFATLIAVASGLLAGAAFAGRFFTWNLTPSLPRGLYWLVGGAHPARGDTVAFAVPAALRPSVVTRRYLPPGTGLLKIVVALAGDQVCLDGHTFAVGGRTIAAVQVIDSIGRQLEPARYCGAVPDGQAFVATAAAMSFDSRYFGAVPLSALTVARPLWTF
jgi:conjugative transfer signal peptidase TraF